MASAGRQLGGSGVAYQAASWLAALWLLGVCGEAAQLVGLCADLDYTRDKGLLARDLARWKMDLLTDPFHIYIYTVR